MIIEKSRLAQRILMWVHSNNTRRMYITLLSKDLNITYCHLSALVRELERQKLVKTNMVGRSKHIKLTMKGGKIAEKLIELKELLDE